MLYQVIGVERKTGDFTPKDEPDKKIHYDNIVFHCVTIKVVDSADLLGSVDAMEDLSKVIGHQFDFDVGFGKIKSWELVK